MTNLLFEPPFGDLGVTYALRLQLVGKRLANFLFAVIEHFRYLLRLRRYKQILFEVGAYQMGVSHFKRKFQVEGDVAPQPSLVSENQSVLLPVSSLFWIGYQRMTVRRTDRRAGRLTELPWLIQRFALQAMRPRCKDHKKRKKKEENMHKTKYIYIQKQKKIKSTLKHKNEPQFHCMTMNSGQKILPQHSTCKQFAHCNIHCVFVRLGQFHESCRLNVHLCIKDTNSKISPHTRN